MKLIVIVLLLVSVGWTSVQLGGIYADKSRLAERVVYHLDFVEENAFDRVKQDLIKDAQEWDIELTATDIHILYTAVDRAVGPQKFVAKLAEFENRQVAITVRYVPTLLGFRLPQEITRSKTRQIAVRQRVRPAYEELLQ